MALVTFVVVQLAAIPLLLSWGRKWWFWADDWDFLAARTGGSLADLFRPHYQHWTTLPILAYRLLWWLFGIRSYVPYQLLIIVLHLTAAGLLRLVMRRAGVGPWFATLLAGVFVFFGSGAENILVAFQITFVGSLVFGLVQLLLADHDGPVNRRDWLALLAGLAGMMCSGVAVAMTLVVGIAMLLRRGWRIALLQTMPLAAAYVVWSKTSPRGFAAGRYRSQSAVQVVKFVFIGLGALFGRLVQVPGLGVALALVAFVGFLVAIRRQGLAEMRGRYAVPFALLVGGGLFLLMTGVVRSGQPALFAGQIGIGPERARQSRYVYIVVAMALPAIAIGADALARRWRLTTVPIVVLLLAGLPGNIHEMRIYADQSSLARAQTKTRILTAPRVPLAKKLARDTSPAAFKGLTLGWLVDSLPSGRIPPPDRLTLRGISSETLALALRRSYFSNGKACHPLEQTEVWRLDLFQSLTLKRGSAQIRYVPPWGVLSGSVPFEHRTTIVGASLTPLDLEIEPVRQPAVLCG